jgi:3-oxoacyl-[acyl-carrier protein] reductase
METATAQNTISFSLSHTNVEQFAAFSGDTNSLHCDDQYARTSKFRKRIVHGFLPLSYLAYLPLDPALQLSSISAIFLQPVHPGDALTLQWEQKEEVFFFKIKKGQNTVTQGKFQVTAAECQVSFDQNTQVEPLLKGALTEHETTFEDIPETTITLPFSMGSEQLLQFSEVLEQHNGTSENTLHAGIATQLMSLSLVSTYTGMYRPGKFATLLDFSVDFTGVADPKEEQEFNGAVKFKSPSTQMLKSEFEFTSAGTSWATGKVSAEVNDKQIVTPAIGAIAETISQVDLKGKVAVITGGSRGLGAYLAKSLAICGCHVVVNYRSGAQESQAIVDEIAKEGLPKAIAVQADVSNKDAVQNMIEETLSAFGRIDILINNAVTDFLHVPFLDLTEDDYSLSMDVIAKGAFHACKAVIPQMVEQKYGRIVNISTSSLAVPVAGHAHYIMAKSALQGLTRSLAVEFGGANITSNLVAPTLMETDLTKQFNKMQLEMMKRNIPAHRLATLNDTSDAVLSILGGLGNYMNGQQIVLNGGAVPFL